MKILFVSDVEYPYLWDYFMPDRFKDIDLVISCGDVKAEYLSFLVTMIPVPLFYVPGNHNQKYIKHPPEGCECIDGKFIKYKNVRIIGLGGSYEYNGKEYEYTEKQMKYRIAKIKPYIWLNKGFDILVTHAPAFHIHEGEDLCHKGFRCFTDLIDKYSPKYFVHGHQHLNYGIGNERISIHNKTTAINAFKYYILDF